MKKSKIQIVVLKTESGTARNEEHLRKVWEKRLEEVAPHYGIENIHIKDRRDILGILLDWTEEEDGEILVKDFEKLKKELKNLIE